MSLGGWIGHWAAQRPRAIAVRQGSTAVTYGQLGARVMATAAALGERGIGPGDRVAFCAHNRVEYLDLLFACARLGAILVPLNNRLTGAEHGFQLDDADPVLIMAADGFAATLRAAAGERRARTVVDLDVEPLADGPAASGVALASPPPAPLPDTMPVLMVYTSGTTGTPKGAVHTQRSLLYTVLNGVSHQDLSARDVVLTFLPLFHVGGLNVQTLPALYVGATVELVARFEPGLVLSLVRERRPTQTLAVPTTLDALLAHPDFAATDLSCLTGVNSGSSVVPTRQIRALLDRGVPVGQVYGATETGPTAVVLRYEDGASHAGSCGRAALHSELRIVDPDRGGDVEDGATGELWLRGAHLFAGYWNNPAASEAAFTDGWYRTGDVGRRDAEGFVFIEDRLRDLVISGGENVYPAEVENVLAEHPAVAEVAVVGRPDARWGEVPVACVVPAADAGAAPTVEELRAWASDRLAAYKLPRDVVMVASMPRTALGKVTKGELRRQLAARGLDGVPPAIEDGASPTEGSAP